MGWGAPGRGCGLWLSCRWGAAPRLASPQQGPQSPSQGRGSGNGGLCPAQRGGGCPFEPGGSLVVRPFPRAGEAPWKHPRCWAGSPALRADTRSRVCFPLRSVLPFLGAFRESGSAWLREPLGSWQPRGKKRRTLPPPAQAQPRHPHPPPPPPGVMSLPCSASWVIFPWAALGFGGDARCHRRLRRRGCGVSHCHLRRVTCGSGLGERRWREAGLG